nr:immunoglobulin heavy chain junction region [Macaca mulatta]MOV86836.1 immunoglobulin heavy chain junction region [Macaca mulatta]MOV86855.1 immunoglobulin heavy chain junction region [Macaca mulatta]MOV86981.1 immunoglobulin heavy chain junction region [Macaca mulatta]MOV86998.1 immunoglobulin heavy chain junction region [Macaca mulatta]
CAREREGPYSSRAHGSGVSLDVW